MNTNHDAERKRALNAIAERFGEWDEWLKGYIARGGIKNTSPVYLDNPAHAFWMEITNCEHDYRPRWFINSTGVRMHKYQCEKCLAEKGIISKQKMQELKIDTLQLKEVTLFVWDDKEPLRQMIVKQGERFLAELRHEAASQRAASYEQYLNSDKWRAIRTKVLRRANGICEGCGEAKATEVHHLTYDRLGHEMLFDLVAVCAKCHREIHKDKEGTTS